MLEQHVYHEHKARKTLGHEMEVGISPVLRKYENLQGLHGDGGHGWRGFVFRFVLEDSET